jgi:hypothetical protein
MTALRVAVPVTLFLAACGGNSTAPTPDFSGTYTGLSTVSATSAHPFGSASTSPASVTIVLAPRTDRTYDLSTIVPGGDGSASQVSINAAGIMSFTNFDPTTALQAVTALFSGLCTTSGAVVTPQGTVQGKSATVQVILTGTTCDWGAGTGTQDLRATIITIADQGTKP